jgi:hypothetical protein
MLRSRQSSLLASLSSTFATAWLTSAFTPTSAAGFLSTALLIASTTSMSFPAGAAATPIAGLFLLFFGYHYLSLSDS